MRANVAQEGQYGRTRMLVTPQLQCIWLEIAPACLIKHHVMACPSHAAASLPRPEISPGCRYMIGEGPRSFVVGYGRNAPQRPHHRAASCPPAPQACNHSALEAPGANPFQLTGALVGGPTLQDSYSDDRSDYVTAEVTPLLVYGPGLQACRCSGKAVGMARMGLDLRSCCHGCLSFVCHAQLMACSLTIPSDKSSCRQCIAWFGVQAGLALAKLGQGLVCLACRSYAHAACWGASEGCGHV